MTPKKKSSHDDRRRHPRGELAAVATVLTTRGTAGTFALENLSAGGALLIGTCDAEPGEPLKILVQLPGRRACVVPAVLLRHERRGRAHLFAVAFRDVPPEVEHEIQRFVLPMVEAMRQARSSSAPAPRRSSSPPRRAKRAGA